MVRELTGGIYFGDSGREGDRAHDDCAYTVAEVERIARVGVPLGAHARSTSVDKANVLETSRLWREAVTRVHAEEFPDVPLDHLLVDNAAMQLVARPPPFDVILTENLFGDILSDEAAMLTGLARDAARAPRWATAGPGLFEPVHGSAPDIAGTRHRQPAGHVRLGGADAAARTGYGTGGRPDRIGHRPRARAGHSHARPRRRRDHRGRHQGRPREASDGRTGAR